MDLPHRYTMMDCYEPRWMYDLGTFRRGEFTFWIFLVVLLLLGAVALASSIETYPQEKNKKSPKNLL